MINKSTFALTLGVLGMAKASRYGYGYGYLDKYPDRGDGKCDCAKYLGAAWMKLQKLIGLEDICCLVGAQIYDDYVFFKKTFDRDGMERSLTEKSGRIMNSLGLSEEDVSQLAKELYHLEENERKLYDEIQEKEDVQNAEHFYSRYNTGCSYDPIWPKDYVNCIINMNFQQATEACYCYYRSQKKCTYKDTCDQKTWKIDVYVAGNPFDACKQCPDGKEYRYDGTPGGYGYYRQLSGYYDKGDPYKYEKGSSFDPCLGYCFIADAYNFKYKFLSKRKDEYD